MTERTITYPAAGQPVAFTQDEIGWAPWLEPLAETELTPRHWEGLTEPSRAKSPYFMLLARDPEILGARTRTDKDIFYNADGGLPRAERELAATATSRANGCIFCASVHSRFASSHSKRRDDVQKLLDEGIDTDLGERWDAIVAAAVTLTGTPSNFGERDINRLRSVGLDDLAIADTIQASAFFNWANRLMLSIGEPTPAKP
jgi:alkylhydroperoxidase domain protein